MYQLQHLDQAEIARLLGKTMDIDLWQPILFLDASCSYSMLHMHADSRTMTSIAPSQPVSMTG